MDKGYRWFRNFCVTFFLSTSGSLLHVTQQQEYSGMKWAVPIDFSNPGLNLKMHTASCGRGGSDVNSCGAGPPGSLLHFSSVQAAFLGLVPRMRVNIGRCFTRRRRLWFFHVYPNLPASREDPSASQSRQECMNTKAKKNRTLAAFVYMPVRWSARLARIWNTLSDSRSTSATKSILLQARISSLGHGARSGRQFHCRVRRCRQGW